MQKNYNENLVAGAAIRDDKGRRISKLFESPHPKMTVGYAKNLIMPNDPTEQEFNLRQAGGGVIEDGVAVIDKVKGNSVVWNQLIPMKANGTTETKNGVTITYTDNGFVLQGTATNTFRFATIGTCNLKEGHKYLTFGGSSGTSLQIELWGGDPIDSRKGQPAIVTISKTPTDLGQINIYCFDGEIFVEKELHWQFCDLTQMFGAGNEPTTYEEFLQRKPKVTDEYTYNEGTIVNNKVEKVVTTGRNLCPYLEQGTLSINNGSEQPSETRVRTPFIPISNKHSYCTMSNKWSIRNGCFYDRNKNFISSGYPSTSTGVLASSGIPANAAFYRLIYSAQNDTDVVTPSYDVFMFAIGNTTIPTTEYEPYEEHELDLSWVKDIKDADGVKLFEDGMRSAGTAFDEVAKGKAIKRIGVKIFDGTEDWAISSGMYYLDDYTLPSSPKVVNSICNTYSFSSKTAGFKPGDDHTYGLQPHGAIVFNDSTYTGVTAWKSHLADLYTAGTPLVVYYELAEPIEVEYDEKSLTYPVVAGGTEEAIASEPSTVFLADIGYGIDAVKTILDLKARVKVLEGK